MKNSVTVKVPATSANLGAGFDCLGLALQFYNEVTLTFLRSSSVTSHRKKEVEIEISGEGKDTLPRDKSNIVYQSAKYILNKLRINNYRLQITLNNRIPITRGLGSSAAARVAGLVAINELTGKKFTQADLFQIATMLEGHPDNVAPAIFGGLCISYTQDVVADFSQRKCSESLLGTKHSNGAESPVLLLKHDGTSGMYHYLKLPVPQDIWAVVCIPEFEIKTESARKILPNLIPRKDAIFNISRVALFISALTKNKYELLGTAMQDKIHQPYRQKLIPGLFDVFTVAKSTGALGVALSGSGPTVLSFVNSKIMGTQVGKMMQRTFRINKINSRYEIVKLNNDGVQIKITGR